MKTYHHNGENWYYDTRSMFKRIRRWFIWIGGWEKANSSGWKLFRTRANGMRSLCNPAPIALLGHRIIHYSWGMDFRLPRRWLSVHWGDSLRGWYIYLSLDGTPSGATCWLLNPPYDVVREASKHIV